MGILKQKKEIRLQIKQATRLLSKTDISKQSENIWQKMEQLAEFKTAKNILCYWSLPFEVETQDFILRNCQNKNIYLPKVDDKRLSIHLFKGVESLKQSSHGIMEPVDDEIYTVEIIDFVVVPGVAFTCKGERLGRGGGYYDRLLPRLPNALKVGVAFNIQLLDQLPCEAHDRILDTMIIGD